MGEERLMESRLHIYILPSGMSSTVLHGVLAQEQGFQFDGILDFANDEWITRVNIGVGPITKYTNSSIC